MVKKANNNLMKEIYQEFKSPIPVDAIQRKSFGDKAAGYNMAFLIERLNDVLISRGCSWNQELLPITIDGQLFLRDNVATKNGNKETVVIRMRVTINNEDGELLASREGFGGCQLINNSLGDTLKGAQTDAMKKIFSYFGLGHSAFKGVIDDQLSRHHYRVNTLIDAIGNYLIKTHGLEEATQSIMGRYMKSIIKKEFEQPNDLFESDWDMLEKAISEVKVPVTKVKGKVKSTTKKTKVKNEQKSGDGEDKISPTEEQLDNPFPEDDSPPF